MVGFSVFKSIYFKIGFFILILFTISIGSYYIISNSLSKKENTSHMVNVAGRGRMLTEEMNKIAIEVVFMGSKDVREELQQSIQDFEQNLYNIKSDREYLKIIDENKEIRNQLLQVEKTWKSLRGDYSTLLAVQDLDDQKLIINDINGKNKEQIANIEVLLSLVEKTGQENIRGLNEQKLILVFTDFPNEKAHCFNCGMRVRSNTEYHR
ncbi:MAG TPA: hypothetical protein GX497_01645 [Bacillus bacterium]|nr:hypothetical protein [Bacillus sp. (in: firmicutes)]